MKRRRGHDTGSDGAAPGGKPGGRTLTQGLSRTSGDDPSLPPGKRSRTERLPIQARAAMPARASDVTPTAMPAGVTDDPFGLHLLPTGPAAPTGGAAAPIQRSPAADATSAPPPVAHGGAALPPDVERRMGGALGADLSAVRVHEGPQAETIGALAYAQGTDLHFAPGQYDPHSQSGLELLGHELTHVVQQAEGRVEPTIHAKGSGINDDTALEREADERGAQAARGEPTTSAQHPALAPPGVDAAQARRADPSAPARLDDDSTNQASSTADDPGQESVAIATDEAADDEPLQEPALASTAPVQSRTAGPPIQRSGRGKKANGKAPKKISVPYQIHVTSVMTADEYKSVAMQQVFGGALDGELVWSHIKDEYTPDKSPYTLNVEVGLLKRARGTVSQARGIDVDQDGAIAGAETRAEAFHDAPASDPKAALMSEIDRRYYEASGVAAGTLIKHGETGRGELWRTIRDEVLFQHAYLADLPPKVKELIRVGIRDRELTPADYDQLFRIARKIENLPAGQARDYASKLTGSTTNLNAFEAALEGYQGEMATRSQQGEEREAIKTKLLGLEDTYKKYREYRQMQGLETAMSANTVSDGSGVVDNGPSVAMGKEVTTLLKAHGFASISEFEGFINQFEKAFELEAVNIAKDLLARYDARLHREAERYRNPGEISALHQKLGGVRSSYATFQSEMKVATDYQHDEARSRLQGNGHLRPQISRDEAHAAGQRAAEAKAAAQADVQGLATEHPIFQEDSLPLDRRIDKAALAQASEGELGGLIEAHIARRTEDVADARDQLEGKSELIYKMDKLMPQFYAIQGIAPGSIYDLIIRDKVREDAVAKLVAGIALAVVAVALAFVSAGAAVPAIVAGGAALAGAGLGAYMAYGEYQEYAEQQDLAGVGFADDPEVVWLVLAIVGAGIDMGAAVKAVRALGPAAKTLNAGGDATEFSRAVRALQEANEIDARIAQAAEKAAAARTGFAQAKDDLTRALTSKAYSLPGPFTDPEVYRALVAMAKAKIQEGVASAQVFIDELRKARALAKLGDMTPEELTKAKEAWEEAGQQSKAADASAGPANVTPKVHKKTKLELAYDQAITETPAQRKQALGFDTKRQQYLPHEGDTGVAIEAQYGYFRRDPADAGDWQSLSGPYAGKIFDLMGVPAKAAPHITKPGFLSKFMESIDDHVRKSVDYVIIDIKVLPDAERAQVKHHVATKWASDAARIFWIE